MENRVPAMRKVLIVIPHYYGAGNGFYGSTSSDVSKCGIRLNIPGAW